MKDRAPRNRTLTIEPHEKETLLARTISLGKPAAAADIEGNVIHQDLFECMPYLPSA